VWKCFFGFAIVLWCGVADARPRGAPDTREQVSFATYGGVCDGVADDTAAFLAFKAAYQSNIPVQLNLPTGTCTFLSVGSGANKFPFKGIGDLVVNGQGAGSTTFKNTSAVASVLFGGSGQYQDNSHSLRTDDANAGDLCVTIKTQPAVTVSAIANSLPVPATFTASISGTTMTVTAVASGSIAIGAYVTDANSQVTSFTSVVSQSTGSAGSTGTYVVSTSQTRTSRTMTTTPASFTATVDATGVMTVSAVADGTLAVGMMVYRELGSVGNPTTIASQLTGSAGSTGTYQLSNAPVSALATPSGFIGNGQPRVTLNSTTGLTTGDTLYLTGVTGSGGLPSAVNGLRWIKVINGTQIDIFQSDFNGAYTSGGTGGGDRTSLTPAGSKVMMSGYVLQAYWGKPYGYPSNPHWFEYKTVTSTNSGTHQVCFDSVLTNSYKSTWPQYNTGNLSEVDPGGPATLYLLDPTWELTHVYQNFTVDNPNFQITANGRNITWSNVALGGVYCAIPTQNETHTWVNVSGPSCDIETDKIVGTWSISGGSLDRVVVQSSSMDLIAIDGLTVDSWFNTSKRLTLANSTLGTFRAGTGIYGAATETTITNTAISTTLDYGTPTSQVDAAGRAWSMSGGVITIPNSYSWDPTQLSTETQTRGLIPGHYVMWAGAGGGGSFSQTGRAFKVVDVTQDIDNTYIQTSEAGGFPTGTWTTSGLSVFAHPAPEWTVSGVTGAFTATSFNGCPAAAPIYSCANFTHTGGASGTSVVTSPLIWGELDTFTFTNNVPYTGGGALGWTISQFGQMPYLLTDNTQGLFGVSIPGSMINIKLPSSCGSCTRTLDQANPSGSNTQSGDSLTAPPAGAVFGRTGNMVFTANTPSDSPQVTVTLRTNQNLP
jgi:hypothetical protein